MLKQVLISLAILPSLIATSYAGIVCYEDKRPVDGAYTEVKLASSATAPGAYDLTLTSSFVDRNTGESHTTTKVLLNDLACNVKGLVAYCRNLDYHTVTISNADKRSLSSLDQREVELERGTEIVVSFSGLQSDYQFNRAHCHVTAA